MEGKGVSKRLGIFSSVLSNLGSIALFAMMCLTMADVAGRYLFNVPITGAFELTEFMVLILIFSFLGYTQAQKSHVSVELLLAVIPKKIRFYIEIFNHLICFLLSLLIVLMSIQRALELKEAGEASPNLAIPTHPFVFFLVLGCLVLAIEYLRDIVELIKSKEEFFEE